MGDGAAAERGTAMAEEQKVRRDIVLKSGEECKADAFAIRTKVFMEEQGYENEFDEIDESAIHVVLYADGAAAGCARVFPEQPGSARWAIGRVAVLPQNREGGFGRMLVEECERAAADCGARELCLHAQARLEGWYGSMGYVRFGEVDYEDEGQPHIWMEKELA